jgi:hypothetical protein
VQAAVHVRHLLPRRRAEEVGREQPGGNIIKHIILVTVPSAKYAAAFVPILVERKVRYPALFTNLVG